MPRIRVPTGPLRARLGSQENTILLNYREGELTGPVGKEKVQEIKRGKKSYPSRHSYNQSERGLHERGEEKSEK